MAKLIGIDQNRPHIAHVAVTVKEPRIVEGAWVLVDNTVEIPVRKSHWDTLKTEKQRETYAQECAEYHAATGLGWEQKRNARRKAWDDDDKVKADAKAAAERIAKEAAEAAAKVEREAKFLFTVTGVVNDKEGKPITLTATVQHHGRTVMFPASYTEDKAVLEASLREAFAKWETEQLAREAFLASMSRVN